MFLFRKPLLVVAVVLCAASLASAETIYDDAVVYYPFEGTGATVSDASGTTAINLAINGTYSREAGMVGNALTLDSGSYVTSGVDVNALDLDRDTPFTIAGWIKVDAESSSLAVASKMQSTSPYRGWWLFRSTHGTLDFVLRSENNNDGRLWVRCGEYDVDNIGQDEWVHVAMTLDYDSGDATYGVRFYLDGQPVAAETYNTTGMTTWMTTDNTVPFNIAGRNDGSQGYGSVDELAIWNRALSSGEIQSLYAAAVPEPSTVILVIGGLFSLVVIRRWR